MHVTVISPVAAMFDGDADAVTAPAFDGEVGILPGHAPFMTLLRRYLDRKGLGVEWDTVASAPGPALINSLCMALPFEPAEKQALLEARDLDERRAALEVLLHIDAALPGDDDDDARPSIQ